MAFPGHDAGRRIRRIFLPFMIILRLLLLIVLSPFALLARLLGGRRGNIVDLAPDHPEMAKAIADARATLPEFMRLLADSQSGLSQFAVKVRFAVDNGHEHCWVSELEMRGTTLTGKLGNQPRGRADLSLGSEVTIDPADITDWSYVDAHGVHRGHYTTRVLMKTLPKRVREDAERVFGWTKAA
jgi:uncharacterized protein YegJ (DUF2314 family)